MTGTGRQIATAVLAVILTVAGVAGRVHAADVRPVPACAEDATVIGAGEFAAGRWSAYACGPAVDDLAVPA